MAVEEPLCRVVTVRLGQAIGVFLGGDFLPVGEVEIDFDQWTSHFERLVDFPYFIVV